MIFSQKRDNILAEKSMFYGIKIIFLLQIPKEPEQNVVAGVFCFPTLIEENRNLCEKKLMGSHFILIRTFNLYISMIFYL